MKHFKSIFLFCLMLVISIPAFAQNRITGQVTDQSGEPVIGANVKIQGTTNGVITDIDGNFSLEASRGTLVVSYIGYKTQEVPIAGNSRINIVLEEDIEALEEVVVVAYGQQKKTTLTGAVTQVKGDDVLKSKATTSVAAALQGEIPGLTITRKSSRPGNEGAELVLRGGISVNEVKPLIIIDGVQAYDWELSQINPNDVENVSVLKDASAALYGTRAAGGVILITTKRGKEGKVKVSYNGSGHANFIGNRFPAASGQQWATMMYEAINNDAVASGVKNWWIFSEDQIERLMRNEGFVEMINPGKDAKMTHVDPTANQFDAVYGTTWGQSHNVSVNGGSEKVKAMVSLGYADDRSLMTAAYDGQKKYNFRSNIDFQVHKNVELAFNLSYDSRMVKTPNQGVGQGLQDFWVFPLYNDKGQFYDAFGTNNILAKLKEGGTNTNKEEIIRIGGQLKLNLDFITKGLSATANANIHDRKGLNKKRAKRVTMYDWDTHVDENGNIVEGGPLGRENNIYYQTPLSNTYIERTDARTLYQSYGGFLNYVREISGHNISLMGGMTAEKSLTEQLTIRRKEMPNNELDNILTGEATQIEILTNDNLTHENDWALVSFLGRLNYDYQGIYLLEGQFRRDGSSRLSKDNRWANFAGASVGIRFSEYDFVRQWGIFNNLKLRGSYGEMGSLSGIGEYDYISKIATGMTTFGPDGKLQNTAWIDGVRTDKRTWERVKSTNIGLDFTILENRLSGVFEWYNRQNNGMLIAMTYPQVFGANSPKTNDGHFRARGWEIALNWNDKIGEDFRYKIGVTLADARTKVTKYEGAIAIINGVNKPRGNGANIIEGKPINAIYVYKTDGYLQNEAEVEAYYSQVSGQGSKIPVYKDANGNLNINRLTPGSVRKVDLNKDGAITEDDLYYYGDANPHYEFGLTLGASYKGIDFNMFIQGVGQQYLLREGAMRYPFAAGWMNQNASYIGKTWSESNLNAPYPVMSRTGSRNNWNYNWYNDINVNNVWYARAKNVVLGYTLPKHIVKKAGVENLRLYVSGDNLFEISNVKDGYDPEAQAATNQGNVDVYARTVSFGIDLTF